MDLPLPSLLLERFPEDETAVPKVLIQEVLPSTYLLKSHTDETVFVPLADPSLQVPPGP